MMGWWARCSSAARTQVCSVRSIPHLMAFGFLVPRGDGTSARRAAPRAPSMATASPTCFLAPRHATIGEGRGPTSCPGRRAVADVDLATPDGSVTAVRLPPHSSYLEATGSGVGDVDGDGLGDLAFGDRYWPNSSCGQEDCSGRAWLVYGTRRLPRRLFVLRLGARGYAIRSGDNGVLLDVGSDVRPAGDLNGDGRADVLVDALYENGTEPFIVWGARRRDHPIGLSGQSARLASRACCFRTDAVAIGDVNGDGRTDLIASSNDSRSIFIVYGRKWSRQLDVSSERPWISRPQDSFTFVAAGDVNGDGVADVLVETVPQCKRHRHRLELPPVWQRRHICIAARSSGNAGIEILGADTHGRPK